MRNATWGYRNHMLSAAITASAAEAALGVEQMQNEQGAASSAWQTPAGVTTAWFQVDAGAALSFGAVGLFRTNLTPAAQIRWRATGLDTGMVSAGVAPGYGQTVRVLAAPVLSQTLRCDISDPTNPDGFVNIALAYAGEAWASDINISPSTALGIDSKTDETETRGGQEWASLQWERRRWDVDHQGIKAGEVWPRLMEMLRVSRRGGNILFVPDPDSGDLQRETVFGRLSSLSDVTYPYKTTELRAWRGRVTERL